jgi:hypothetical protein
MVTVLRRLNGSGILEEYPNLSAYVARGEARPAYKRAFFRRSIGRFHRQLTDRLIEVRTWSGELPFAPLASQSAAADI